MVLLYFLLALLLWVPAACAILVVGCGAGRVYRPDCVDITMSVLLGAATAALWPICLVALGVGLIVRHVVDLAP